MFLNNIWMIPLLPLLGAALMFFIGKRLSRNAVNLVCVGVIVLAFAFSVGAVLNYSSFAADNAGQPFERTMFTWMGTGNGLLTYPGPGGVMQEFRLDAGFLLDPLSAIWLLFVTGVGMLIHIYSVGYMAHEGGYYRFFGFLNLFMFSMLTLILANNYALMFVGWEGVGLCSYLLIGFYFKRHSASTAANKAFIVNRIGDAGFLLGMFTLAWYFGSLQYTTINRLAAENAGVLMGSSVMFTATLLLFVGATGKSAQIPLYVWLPDAMEGPTPVSALIHAATMVTAGVYMVARSNVLFTLAPETMKIVAVVGALTAIFAASIGLVQNDIKRVLAYSTVSQLGYMFLALGVGAFAAGVFHVFTHAFFKALLFLGAGSVIHAMSGEQDLRYMGNLAKKIPITFRTMLVGTIAIAGIPPLAGFFSKDEILWMAWSANGGQFRVLWYVGFATALMTAFYMFRLLYLTFWSPSRMSHEAEHHVHESPATMTFPLTVLAAGAIFAGFLGVPASLGGANHFEHYLSPVFAQSAQIVAANGHAAAPVVHAEAAPAAEAAAHAPAAEAAHAPAAHHDTTEYVLMVLSIGAAILGWVLARRAYKNAGKDYREPIQAAVPPVYQAMLNKYYVDEAYDYAFTGRRRVGNVRLGAMGLGTGMWKFDANVIDGGVNGAGWITRLSGTLSYWWDKWIIDFVLVNGTAYATRPLSWLVRLTQWGQLQLYALVMIAGVLGFVIYSIAK